MYTIMSLYFFHAHTIGRKKITQIIVDKFNGIDDWNDFLLHSYDLFFVLLRVRRDVERIT